MPKTYSRYGGLVSYTLYSSSELANTVITKDKILQAAYAAKFMLKEACARRLVLVDEPWSRCHCMMTSADAEYPTDTVAKIDAAVAKLGSDILIAHQLMCEALREAEYYILPVIPPS